MVRLFGGKWERENGNIGGTRFYDWADVIEPLAPKQIRAKFTELERRFKIDVQAGKDIWPPTMALFLALEGQKRVNEAMYKEFTFALPKHTRDEYQKMGKKGMDKLRKSLK